MFTIATVMTAVMRILKFSVNEGVTVKSTLAEAAVVFAIFTVILMIQLPIYFKLSYAKAQILSMMPFFILAAAFVATRRFKFGETTLQNLENWIQNDFALLAVCGAAAIVLIVFVSYHISLAFYKKREF